MGINLNMTGIHFLYSARKLKSHPQEWIFYLTRENTAATPQSRLQRGTRLCNWLISVVAKKWGWLRRWSFWLRWMCIVVIQIMRLQFSMKFILVMDRMRRTSKCISTTASEWDAKKKVGSGILFRVPLLQCRCLVIIARGIFIPLQSA